MAEAAPVVTHEKIVPRHFERFRIDSTRYQKCPITPMYTEYYFVHTVSLRPAPYHP